MQINLLFFIIFIIIGFILIFLALIFKSKYKKMLKLCNEKIKGKVIKYTLWSNNGVSFPIVEYSVNNIKHTQRLKYGWVIVKSSPFNKIETQVENNIESDNLVIIRNQYISVNPIKEKFPIGTELDVYYNPQKPKKSYVMRLIKNPCIKLFSLIGLICIIVAFIGLIVIPRN